MRERPHLPLASLAKTLDLQRPLVGLDVETTGTNAQMDRIVQIGAIKVTPEGEVIEKSTLVNPEIPIPPEITKIHGITDEMARQAPTFRQLAASMAEFFHMVDWVGYNIPFDLRFVAAEYKRTNIPVTLEGRIYDANRVFFKYHPRNLQAAVREYLGPDGEKEFLEDGAHDAAVDVYWTMRVAASQLERHTDIPRSMEAIHVEYFETPEPGYFDPEKKFAWRGGELVFNFGKWNGAPLRKVAQQDMKYLRWVLGGEFTPIIMKLIKDATNGIYPEAPAQ